LAVFVEVPQEYRGDYRVYLASWENKNPEKRFVELLGQEISMFSEWKDLKGLKCSDFEFSPDGRWLVFRDNSEMVLQSFANQTFMVMPADIHDLLPPVCPPHAASPHFFIPWTSDRYSNRLFID
jgi:hypothetical protein